MTDAAPDIDGFLESILRGAALLLGCNSANLIVYNAGTRQASVRVGVVADQKPMVSEIEALLNAPLKGAVFPITDVDESLVLRAWSRREVTETSSLAELVGANFPVEMVEMVSGMIGPRRYVLIPVVRGAATYGIALFEKAEDTPFSLQQREVMLRYAHRIGELIENEVRAFGTSVSTRSNEPDPAYVMFDASGEIIAGLHGADGERPSGASGQGDEPELPWIDSARREARRLLTPATGDALPDRTEPSAAELPALCHVTRLVVRGEPVALATFAPEDRSSATSVTRQLLHLATGDSVPTVLVDPQYRITSCNQATARLLGYTSAELQSQEIGQLFQDPDGIRAILNDQFLFLTDGVHEDDAVLRHRTGALLPGSVKALQLADGDHAVVGYLVMMRDRADKAASGDGTLDHAMRQERLATMGEMAAQLAHEIRNPLLAIGATLDSLANEDPAEIPEVAALLSGEVARLDLILKDYMSLAVRANGSLSKVALGPLLETVIRVLTGGRRAGRAKISAQVEAGLTTLADREGMKQVLFNLLLNATEASKPDGTITCTARAEQDYVSIAIEDDGPGLPEEPSRCFEAFFTTKSNGSGLGLAVSQRIVAAHGGTIELQNRPGGGCRATVTVPKRISS